MAEACGSRHLKRVLEAAFKQMSKIAPTRHATQRKQSIKNSKLSNHHPQISLQLSRPGSSTNPHLLWFRALPHRLPPNKLGPPPASLGPGCYLSLIDFWSVGFEPGTLAVNSNSANAILHEKSPNPVNRLFYTFRFYCMLTDVAQAYIQ